MRTLFVAMLTAMLAACAGGGGSVVKTESTARAALPTYLVARDVPAELVALERAGRLAEAEAWLDRNTAADAPPDDPFVIERQRLARVRRDYGQTPERLLEVLRADIPDVSEDDFARWRAAGQLQWAEIDGEMRYFRKEPRNLFRFSDDARARRDAVSAAKAPSVAEADPNARRTERFDLHDSLELYLAESAKTGNIYPGEVRIRAKHTVTVDAGAVPEGETVRCWIPFPKEYHRQRDVKLLSASTDGYAVAPNETGHRTAYQERPAAAPGQPTVFSIEYEYTTSAYIPVIDAHQVRAVAPESDIAVRYLRSEPPHVDLTPEVRKLAAEIVDGETNPLLAADRIFRWIDGNIRYCSEMEYSTFTSITDKIMTDRTGDCGIHVLVFVALCRAAGIPARWQSGWAMRPENENLHDWAEFYVEPYGWLPADPSFGLRKHDDPRVRDFYIGHIDPFRMIANIGYAEEFNPPKTHWRSDNIDNQRGEVEWSGGNLYYDQWTYGMDVEYEFR